MAHLILADITASISELKRNPIATVASGEGSAVAILNRNEPAFYCIPAKRCLYLVFIATQYLRVSVALQF
ncbi:hypothetical protein [Zwartia sp.]|uniref:hypothetical protein n=1 Tax=Zwartia sp. TaxID=2978004 RepID=UPI003BB214F5